MRRDVEEQTLCRSLERSLLAALRRKLGDRAVASVEVEPYSRVVSVHGPDGQLIDAGLHRIINQTSTSVFSQLLDDR